jgi:hypothetical protein
MPDQPSPLTLNSTALHGAMYEAEQLAKALHLVFWLRDDAPKSARYHLTDAYERIARLNDELEQVETPDAPLSDEEVIEAGRSALEDF